MKIKIGEKIRQYSHMWGYILFDIIAVLMAEVFALVIRFDMSFVDVDPDFWEVLLKYFAPFLLLCVIVFAICNLYSTMWRYADMRDIFNIVCAIWIIDVVAYIFLKITKERLPRSFYIFFPVLLLMLMIMGRLWRQILRTFKNSLGIGIEETEEGIPTLIYGAGEAGRSILEEIQKSTLVTRHVPCVLDDDERKWGTYMLGVPITGGREKLMKSVEDHGIKEIMIAIPTLTSTERREITEACNETGCKVSILPGIYQLLNKEVSISTLRKVELEDLLGRDPIEPNLESVMKYVSGRVVMVTGGGGSIGSELCRQIAGYQPKQLIVVDNYENNAYDLQMELQKTHPELNLVVLIASVQNKQRIGRILNTYKPDLLYHAAAHKHVPLMEVSPCEAVKNNVFGTVNVARAAGEAGVKRFVMISTDKAVRPTNVMGATKRICEMIIQTSGQLHPNTEYVAVRFGNVLGSNGSVVPLFKKQIAAGGPVTVTHPDIIRYFMTIPEAVALVLQAGGYAKGGEIFILDMGEPVRIADMAKNLIRLSGLKPDVDIKIEYTGLRPGEKLYEELLMDEEKTGTENARIFVGQQIPIEQDFLIEMLHKLHEAAYSEQCENIRDLIKELVPEYTYTPNLDGGFSQMGAVESDPEGE